MFPYKRNRTYCGLLIATITVLISAGGCGEPEIESNFLDREIMIDGNDAEWGGLGVFDDTENGSRISATNDDRDIYICLSTSDPRTQIQVLRNGLTVWFDREGGKERRFGINYPMRSFSEQTPIAGMTGQDGRGNQKSGQPPAPDPRLIRLLLMEIPGAVEIIGPERDMRLTRSIEDAGVLGIEAAIEMRDGRLVYELKVPLALSPGSIYAIGAGPPAKLGVGILTGRAAMDGKMPSDGMRPSGGRSGGRNGGMGGPGGGMDRPGGSGGPGSGGTRTPAQPLEAWIKLRLASIDGDSE